MSSSLGDFTARLLTESGAVLEPRGDGLEVLLPADVAGVLGIPEHANLSFSGEDREGISVSYDSELLKKMAKLMSDGGKFSTVSLAPPSVRMEKLEERLDQKVVFHNAVFHVERKEEKRVSYLLGYSKYSALSDDRQEGILACLINELNLSVQKTTPETLDLIELSTRSPVLAGGSRAGFRPTGVLEGATDLPVGLHNYTEEPVGEAERESSERVLTAFWHAQEKIVKEELSDFLLSVERRMNRDIRRVHDYYQTLIHEHRQWLERKAAAAEEKEKTVGKIEVIERELKGKIQDLIGKFSLELQIEPISFVRIETTSPTWWLSVKRRKEARPFPLTYNPILKSLDPLPCEACFYPAKGHYVCDDRLHIVCRQCFGPCPRCGKIYCGACHPKGCPRCKVSAPA